MSDDIICSKCGSPNKPDTVFCGKCGTRLVHENPEERADPLIGAFVGDRFLVHEKLGEGGMGVVYRAEQTAIQREVALKVLHSNLTQDESLYARFQNEAAASSRLNHPNTITIYDFGKTGENSLYIAMEFIRGKSLDDEIRLHGPLDVHRACHVAIQICGSLQDAHDNAIVHRDLKPENVMLCERAGDKDVVKVLDFGIAKIMEDDGTDQRKALTKTGMVFGTPQYMSPEQIRGEKVDHKTDIYSLGVILYQMLSGRLPFTADTPMGLLTKHLMDQPQPFDGPLNVPKEIEAIVMAALEKDPGKRPESMKALQKSLSTAIGLTTGQMRQMAGDADSASGSRTIPEHIVAPKSASSSDSHTAKKGLPVGLIAAGIIVLLGGGAAAWYFTAGPGSQRQQQAPQQQGAGVAVAPPSTPASLGQVVPPVAPSMPQAGSVPATGVAPAPLPFDQAHPGATEPETPDKPKNDKKTPKEPSKAKTPEKHPAPETPKPAPKDPEDTPKNPDPPAKETPAPVTPAKCKFSGGDSPLDKALRKSLRSKEDVLKACTKTSAQIDASYTFRIEKDAKKPSDIAPKIKAPNECVERVFASVRFKPNSEDAKNGLATFAISQKDGIVDKCKIYTKIITDISKIRIPAGIRLKRQPKKKDP